MRLFLQCYLEVMMVFGALAGCISYIGFMLWLVFGEKSPLPDKDWLRIIVLIFLLSIMITAVVYIGKIGRL